MAQNDRDGLNCQSVLDLICQKSPIRSRAEKPEIACGAARHCRCADDPGFQGTTLGPTGRHPGPLMASLVSHGTGTGTFELTDISVRTLLHPHSDVLPPVHCIQHFATLIPCGMPRA